MGLETRQVVFKFCKSFVNFNEGTKDTQNQENKKLDFEFQYIQEAN